MHIHLTQPLFPWEELDDSPSLDAVKQLLALVPDHQLLDALQRRRHNGNNTYPVRVLWGTLLLSIFLRHPTMRACLEELRRNLGLRLLIGIESQRQVPNDWNMTRFLDVLGQEPYLGLLRGVFDQLIRRLGGAIGDFGRDTAGDATYLSPPGQVNPKHGSRECKFEGASCPAGFEGAWSKSRSESNHDRASEGDEAREEEKRKETGCVGRRAWQRARSQRAGTLARRAREEHAEGSSAAGGLDTRCR
jgi:hypothetical protein